MHLPLQSPNAELFYWDLCSQVKSLYRHYGCTHKQLLLRYICWWELPQIYTTSLDTTYVYLHVLLLNTDYGEKTASLMLWSTVIFCHQWMMAESHHWLWSTFPLPWRPLTIPFTLLWRLDDWFGATRKALAWFKSYLNGTCQRIKLCNCQSCKANLPSIVTQGPVPGPLLFTLNTPPPSSIISDRLSLTTSMLVITNCTCHLHQATLHQSNF